MYILFQGNPSTQFSNNKVDLSGGIGGAIYSHTYSYISFEGNSVTVFSNNTADYGGAICSSYKTYIIFKGQSVVELINNNAGAIVFGVNSYISFEGKSITMLSNNTATYGGAILSIENSNIYFKENCTTVFNNNFADRGGAILVDDHSKMIFDCNSSVLLNNNTATIGATILCIHDSKVIVKGHSSIFINDLSAKWCANVCLPYTGETDTVIVNSNGLVWCNNKQSFNCISDKCHCKDLKHKLGRVRNNQLVNITDETVVLSSIIYITADNISIISHNNATVICVDRSGLKISFSDNLTIEGITWVGCGATEAVYAIVAKDIPVIEITNSKNVIIQTCFFKYSMGQVIRLRRVSGYANITNCTFVNSNHYRDHGAAMYCSVYNAVAIINCEFSTNKCAKSIIFIQQETLYNPNIQVYIMYLINSIFFTNEGTCVYLSNHNLHISGEVLFENNVAEDGTGIYVSGHSTVMFGENSNTIFINNTADQGGAAIYLNNNSNAIFDKNSNVTFYDNKATNGTICSKHSSVVMFKATCNVTFNRNLATQYGGAIYSFGNSQVILAGNTIAVFKRNIVSFNDRHLQLGGTMYSENNSFIIFGDNSFIVFNNNSADFGSAIFSYHNSYVIFKDSSRVILITT